MYLVFKNRCRCFSTELNKPQATAFGWLPIKTTAMNIGTITYSKYDEKVLLNRYFNSAELFKIILNDRDFVRFEIFDRENNLLLSTHYPNVEHKGICIKVVKVKKEEEITGTTYDAYRTPSTIHRIKVRWNVNGARFRTKKKAIEYADSENRKTALKIERFVDRR